eukprot:CAMPEP_0168516216 /NCGR_PEP_ID=MMETSP0405-20121227/5271_1 /TAXON_ID=498012 /ORGANISM="Trichosphaerium sp, Strain Am-I-7 wt" /LENGTH=204 /DNA_ID=CAMNT_0008535887 /DNA_START=16 /DNA_END=626 /DNA_ORIENTATION=-
MSSIPLHFDAVPTNSDDIEDIQLDTPHEASSADRGFEKASCLPEKKKDKLLKALGPGESLEYVEQPAFWRAQGPAFAVMLVGSIALIVVLCVNYKLLLGGSTMMIAGTFPLALIMIIYSAWTHKNRYVAFTDKRVIIELSGKHKLKYDDISGVTTQFNYLFCRHDIVLTSDVSGGPRPKKYYIEAIPRADFYIQFLQGQTSTTT